MYNYTEITKQIPSVQTPISINPNYDWSTRAFTQVPTNNKNLPQNYEFFEKYANSNLNSPPKIGDVNIKLTNTVNQR